MKPTTQVLIAIVALAILMNYTWIRIAHEKAAIAIELCGSDADCHAKHPGLCSADEPYCFEGK